MFDNSFPSREIGLGPLLVPAALLLACAIPASAGEQAAPPFPSRTEAQVLFLLAHPDDEGVLAPLLAREALDGNRAVVGGYVTSGMNGTDRSRGLSGPAFALARLTELHWTLDRLGVAMFHCLERRDAVAAGGEPGRVLKAWDREKTVAELTRLVRFLRPREVITWVPGPAAAHMEHAAAGAAALLAVRAAADPRRFPLQIREEGLEPWKVAEVFVVGQADKLGYPSFPSSPPPVPGAGERVRVEPVDGVSPSRGVRYVDIAREAMKEQRAVAMAHNLDRGGPFDDPLRLTRVFSPDLPDPAGGIRLRPATAGSQAFFEELSAEIGDPDLPRFFPAEILVRRGGPLTVSAQVENGPAEPLRGEARLELPEGWELLSAPGRISVAPGGAARLEWRLAPPDPLPAGIFPARLALVGRGRVLRERLLALRASAPPPGGGLSAKTP